VIQAASPTNASHNLPLQVTKKAWKNLPPREEKCLNKKIYPAGESRNAGLKQAEKTFFQFKKKLIILANNSKNKTGEEVTLLFDRFNFN